MQQRRLKNQPVLTFNHLPTFVDQIVGDQRQNRPSIKVRPVQEDVPDLKVANKTGNKDYTLSDTVQGIISNIQYQSRAEVAYDTAYEHAVAHGFGYWRIVTEYADDETFDLDIRIKRVTNSYAVYLDPYSTEPDGSDARFGFVVDTMDEEAFKSKYPDVEPGELEHGIGDYAVVWAPEKGQVRIAEYFWIESEAYTLCLLSDGRTVIRDEIDEAGLAAAGLMIVKERKATRQVCRWAKVTGAAVLEPEREFPSKYIPIVPVYGKEEVIDGKLVYRGAIRHAKDAQRTFNYWMTAATERVALAPKSPYIGTLGQFDGLESLWRTANTENHAYLPYNPDPKAPGAPKREQPPAFPAAEMGVAQTMVDEMKATTGLYNASLGERSNETSGKAIMARQREGDVATFAFVDNLSRSIEHTGRILIDMIPRVYDTERVMRLRFEDDTEDFVMLNQTVNIDGQEVVINDLSAAKYDVVVTTGPSYTTQRMESLDAMLQMTQANPELWTMIGDLIMKNSDWPGADEIAKRLRKMLPPGMAEAESEEEQAMMQQADQPPPDPVAEMEARAKMAKAEAEIIKAQKEMAELGSSQEDFERRVVEVVARLFSELGIAPSRAA